jgi:hypothetical protein
LLAAQFLRNIPTYANQKYDDGSTLAQQYEVRRDYFLKWFDERAKRGQFVEAASPSYQGDSIAAIFNIRDFAEDEVLRKKADMYLDLIYANIAEETLLTTRGGPKSRVKVGHEYEGHRPQLRLLPTPGRTLALGVAASTRTCPPPWSISPGTRTRKLRVRGWPGPVAEGGGRANDPMEFSGNSIRAQRAAMDLPRPVMSSARRGSMRMARRRQYGSMAGRCFGKDPTVRIGFG